ncbi:MAG: serine hydrolase [Rubrivivax sp.]|nr:serine hydrolase [Rubrivivax sp.]
MICFRSGTRTPHESRRAALRAKTLAQRLRSGLALLVLIGLLPGAWANTAPGPARVDAPAIQAWMDALQREDLALASLAVQQGDGAPLLRAIGAARLEPAGPRAASPATRYRIGSISKMLTAILVLQLVDEGRLSLDDPLSRWFPGLPQAQAMRIEHLLAHRSGLGEIQHLAGFQERWRFEPRQEAELLAAIASLPRAFAPGERTQYNNSGYLLLGFVIEHVSGRSYAQQLQQRLVQPLGLQDTAFEPGAPADGPHAVSYRPAGSGWQAERATDATVPRAAGGVVSSPRDLVTVVRALFRGRLLAPATLERMQRAQGGLGLGLMALPGAGPQAYGHEGVIDGFTATVAYFPQADLAVAWCANGLRLPRELPLQTLRRALFDPSAALPGYGPLSVELPFSVDLALPAGDSTPGRVTVRGNTPPLSWERGTDLQRDPQTGRWQATLTLQAREGLPVEYKYLLEDRQWERSPNRQRLIEAAPARAAAAGTRLDFFNHDAAREAVRAEVLAADERLFAAFNRRDLATLSQAFSPRLEFFHDRTGLSGHAENLRIFDSGFQRGTSPRRERVPQDQEVHALGDFGAFHRGSHRFCRGEGAQARCETVRFAHVWERTPQGWQLLRVISYDH